MSWNNLDLRCAVSAEKIVDELRQTGAKRQEVNRLCTDSSIVLSEHGLYAGFLFLWDGDKPIRKKTREGAYSLLADIFADALSSRDAANKLKSLDGIRRLSEDLNSLLLARRLTAQILAYVRYHAKGLPDSIAAAPAGE